MAFTKPKRIEAETVFKFINLIIILFHPCKSALYTMLPGPKVYVHVQCTGRLPEL